MDLIKDDGAVIIPTDPVKDGQLATGIINILRTNDVDMPENIESLGMLIPIVLQLLGVR